MPPMMGSHWALLGYPVVVPCHEDPAILDLEGHPFHRFKQLIDVVYVEVSQLIALVLSLGDSWIGQVTSFSSWSLLGELSSTASANSPNVDCSKEWGQLSCSQVLKFGPLKLIPPGAR